MCLWAPVSGYALGLAGIVPEEDRDSVGLEISWPVEQEQWARGRWPCGIKGGVNSSEKRSSGLQVSPGEKMAPM